MVIAGTLLPVTTPQRSYSVGPSLPRWAPRSWSDIESAAAAGSLDETRWIELKEAVPAASKPANLELARDLASLGADGGLLIIGIEDAHGRAGKVVGTDEIDGLRDRVDQVARSTVHPPLSVTSFPISDPGDPDGRRGCLIVSVPASPDAPHMVDKHYWGRGDTGKVKLDDSQVQRYFEARRLRQEEAAAKLHEWINTSSVRENTTDEGRLYVTISARGALGGLFGDLMYRGDGSLPEAIQKAADAVEPASYFRTSISAATNYFRGNRSEGYTSDFATTPVGEDGLVVVEVQESGVVNTMKGRVAAPVDSGRFLAVSMVQEVVHQSLLFASDLGVRAGYYGQWNVGIHITRILGAVDSELKEYGGVANAAWREETYEQVFTVTDSEMSENTTDVVFRLLLPLARALRVDGKLSSRLDRSG